ncbi:arsenical pump-driving ATPase [Roseiconus nitratireducens]|uniref:arsenite-transporting ATPase n=1 Tax=Roseiconus nitratireducens TaxID=2605748 RepID=A0A5M6D352_9BACT|nr:arsenical pump-driving ATPase [Roseiconus nitratireducens]KAA5541020.1 arsenical pump-driving ATPase [Roseiconus nitratireducens]
MKLIATPTRYLLFTGKGGVGKTSMACAAAVSLADRGRRVLLVSTDPASNLDEVLATPLSNRPTAITSVENLWAMNIDPEQAARDYRERMVAPYRHVLPEAAVQSMEEQFSGSCTLEIAAFDEFAKLLGDSSATGEFDHIVFDTAPTGHTLRLLTLPSAWSGFMENNTSGTSCLGPLAALETQQAVYRSAVQALADPKQTTMVLVTRPESTALREADRTGGELRALGIENQHLLINGVFAPRGASDPIAVAMQERCDCSLAQLPESLSRLPKSTVSLVANGLVGVDSLRQIASDEACSRSAEFRNVDDSGPVAGSLPMTDLVAELGEQSHGVILTMGKGGVGKTSVAAAVAVALAEQGRKVNLSTTDPAAHLQAAMASDQLPGLTVGRIDPAEVTAVYRDEVMRTAGAGLDAQGKALLEEDLRSPCTEEIAVFRAFADAVAKGEDGFVVLDTAPTGHTILLLDAALAYHREVARQSSQVSECVKELLPRLRDSKFTKVLVVTLAESTPVHEAAKLQEDLRRAGIEPYAWIINQSLTPLEIHDPVLVGRRSGERGFIDEVITTHSKRTVVLPWQVHPPSGLDGLRELIAGPLHASKTESTDERITID